MPLRFAWLALLPAMLMPVALGAESRYWLSGEAWDRPRDGRAVVALAPVAAAVRELEARPGARLLIRYPGGETGALWAHELRAWLVALGVPGARLVLLPGSGRADALALEIE